MSVVATPSAELLLDVRNSTGECPVWHAQQQALYWVDIPEKKLYRYRLSDASLQVWTAPEMLACMVRTASDNGWIVACETGMFAMDTSSDAALGFSRVARVGHTMDGMRFNDGRCDRQGRFLASTMLMDMSAARAVGHVYRLEKNGELTSLLSPFTTPNGMAFSPDGRTMYLSDSHPSQRQVWAYDYDTDAGVPSNPRSFIGMSGFAGRPDGAAVDTDGCYWICGNDAGLVHRYTPEGVLDMSVSVPAAKPAMCAFGGADMRTLFITSIRPAGSSDAAPGGLFAVQLPSVQGLPEPVCRF